MQTHLLHIWSKISQVVIGILRKSIIGSQKLRLRTSHVQASEVKLIKNQRPKDEGASTLNSGTVNQYLRE